jgi:hypothetical protein
LLVNTQRGCHTLKLVNMTVRGTDIIFWQISCKKQAWRFDYNLFIKAKMKYWNTTNSHRNSSNLWNVNLVSLSFAHNYSSELPSPNFHLPMKFLLYVPTGNCLLYHQHDDSRRLTGTTLVLKASTLYKRALQSGNGVSKCHTKIQLQNIKVQSKVSRKQQDYEPPN